MMFMQDDLSCPVILAAVTKRHARTGNERLMSRNHPWSKIESWKLVVHASCWHDDNRSFGLWLYKVTCTWRTKLLKAIISHMSYSEVVSHRVLTKQANWNGGQRTPHNNWATKPRARSRIYLKPGTGNQAAAWFQEWHKRKGRYCD